MRKFGLLLVSVAGLMVWGADVSANTPDAQFTASVRGSSAADPSGTQTPPTQAAAASDPDEIVCKTLPPPTGTRLGSRRECHTQKEWDDRMRQDQAKTNQIQNEGYQQHLPGGG